MSHLFSSTFGRALELLVPSKAFLYLLPLLLKWISGIESSFHIVRSTAGSQAERQRRDMEVSRNEKGLVFYAFRKCCVFLFSPQWNSAGGIKFICRISCWILLSGSASLHHFPIFKQIPFNTEVTDVSKRDLLDYLAKATQ